MPIRVMTGFALDQSKCLYVHVEKHTFDPIALVGYLLAEFDGSESMTAEIRRLMSQYLASVTSDHPVRNGAEVFLNDLEILAFVLSTGASDRARVRLYLWLEFASVVLAAKVSMY